MGGIFYMNNLAKSTINIDGDLGAGDRAFITRNAAGFYFYISPAATNPTLSITNAVVTGPGSASGGAGAILIDAGVTSTLNLENTIFNGNTAGDALGYGGAISALYGTRTTVNGNVQFTQNQGINQAGGAVGIYGAAATTASSITFTGQTHFESNTTTYYGGALALNYWASATFEESASFKNNHVTQSGVFAFGGAIDLYGGNSHLTFEKDASFEGNFVKSSGASIYGSRGGAINLGYIDGNAQPQLVFEDTATFKNNYAWGTNGSKAYGGALSMMYGADGVAAIAGTEYGASIATGIFESNHAYAESSAGGYGGAIYTNTINNTLSLGSGSQFSDNYASTLGGAIYFDQGTLNLTGDVVFQGNRHGVSFSTAGNILTPDTNSGTANAIYFGVSSNTATLNLASASGEKIEFYDPITAASGKSVAVNKTGAGEMVFYQHDSNLRAITHVSEGTFRLANGASYGLNEGTVSDSSFTLDSGATLHAEADATLRAHSVLLNGQVNVESGAFHVDAGNAVNFGSSATLVLDINSATDYSQIVFDTAVGININNANLVINAAGYVPSANVDDVFTIVTGISGSIGQFSQGTSITINGAEFDIVYNASSIVLQQSTAAVPEPATYAIIAGFGLLIFAAWKKKFRS